MVIERRHIRSLHAGPLRIVVEYQRELDDEGPVVSVYGDCGGQQVEVLEFQCLQNDPKYIYAPSHRREVHRAKDEGILDLAEWTLHRLERNLPDMIRRAGFGELADRVQPELVAQQIRTLQELLASSETGA
jgi:hypothetical protein